MYTHVHIHVFMYLMIRTLTGPHFEKPALLSMLTPLSCRASDGSPLAAAAGTPGLWGPPPSARSCRGPGLVPKKARLYPVETDIVETEAGFPCSLH